jgi:hypothetical protein
LSPFRHALQNCDTIGELSRWPIAMSPPVSVNCNRYSRSSDKLPKWPFSPFRQEYRWN